MSNLAKSVIFMTTLRSTICECVDMNSDLSAIDKVETKNFITNEASDYEIIHLAVEGDFPAAKYDSVHETKLFEDIKTCIVENFSDFSKMLSENVATDFITDVEPLTEFGLTSCAPVMEFMLEHGMVSEGPLDFAKGALKKKATPYTGMTRKGIGHYEKGRDIRAAAGSKATSVKGKISGAAKSSKDYVAGFAGTARTKNPENYNSISNSMVKGEKHRMKALDSVEKVKTFARSKTGKTIGYALLAALVTYAAYQVYKRKFSPAAKACKGTSGPERTNCFNKFKEQAIKAQIAQLRSGLGGCNSTKDPGKCKDLIGKKIQKLQAKI